MIKAKRLKQGDKVAIVSLSSGLLGEDFVKHNLELGTKRLKDFGLEPVFMPNSLKGIEDLKEHPEARAQDLKDAFADDSIKGIICAIGGDDTYRLLPYLLEDKNFIENVKNHPKLFTGFSDTTVNHLMFHNLGLTTYYGPSFITDLGEMATDMLPYNKEYFLKYIEGNGTLDTIKSSPIWYEDRIDFSEDALGTDRVSHIDTKGFELLQGDAVFSGKLLGGCLESLGDILAGERYTDEVEVCAKYNLFPNKDSWEGKILFIETCEEKISPKEFAQNLNYLKEKGVFEVINGIIVGKPQDEVYYQEYKDELIKVIDNPDIPIVYNVNFGHANPRCVLPYGIECQVDSENNEIRFTENVFGE